MDNEFSNIKNLFEKALSIAGVFKVDFKRNIIAQSNRADLMIVVDMDEDALSLFDSSDVHKQWKNQYAQYIDIKIIFDSEDEL